MKQFVPSVFLLSNKTKKYPNNTNKYEAKPFVYGVLNSKILLNWYSVAALRWESDSKWLGTGDWTWRVTDGRIHSKWKFNLCETHQHLIKMKCIKMETRNVFGSSSWISCLKFLKLSFLIFNVSKEATNLFWIFNALAISDTIFMRHSKDEEFMLLRC